MGRLLHPDDDKSIIPSFSRASGFPRFSDKRLFILGIAPRSGTAYAGGTVEAPSGDGSVSRELAERQRLPALSMPTKKERRESGAKWRDPKKTTATPGEEGSPALPPLL